MSSREVLPNSGPDTPSFLDRIDLEDLEDARELLVSEIGRGNYPVISIPIEYVPALEGGLYPHTSWVEQARLRAKLGAPYLPENQVRRCFRIKKSVDAFRPERTGPDRHFHGIVSVIGPVSLQDLEEVPCEVYAAHQN